MNLFQIKYVDNHTRDISILDFLNIKQKIIPRVNFRPFRVNLFG